MKLGETMKLTVLWLVACQKRRIDTSEIDPHPPNDTGSNLAKFWGKSFAWLHPEYEYCACRKGMVKSRRKDEDLVWIQEKQKKEYEIIYILYFTLYNTYFINVIQIYLHSNLQLVLKRVSNTWY